MKKLKLEGGYDLYTLYGTDHLKQCDIPNNATISASNFYIDLSNFLGKTRVYIEALEQKVPIERFHTQVVMDDYRPIACRQVIFLWDTTGTYSISRFCIVHPKYRNQRIGSVLIRNTFLHHKQFSLTAYLYPHIISQKALNILRNLALQTNLPTMLSRAGHQRPICYNWKKLNTKQQEFALQFQGVSI